MTSRILSWGGNELDASPVLPSRASSIVSIDPILPNLNTHDSEGSPIALEAEVNESADSAFEKTKRETYTYAQGKAEAKAKKEKEEERERHDNLKTRETRMAASPVQAATQAEGRATAATAASSSSQNPAWAPGDYRKIVEAMEAVKAQMNAIISARKTFPSPSPKDESSPAFFRLMTDPRGSSVAKSPRKSSASPRSESRNVGGLSSSVRRSPISDLVSRQPASSISTTSATATAWSTSNMSLAALLNLNRGKREVTASQTKHAINPMDIEAVKSRAPTSSYARADGSYLRHEKYFFKDGNITFLVEGTLYCIHRYFFSRDSEYFFTRFSQLAIRDHEALPTVISLGDVERKDFEAFLSVIYPENFEKHDLSYKEWVSVLQLSTRWGFASLRKLALASMKPPTPHDQLLLARAYSIDHWIVPALSALCERTAPLSLDEAREMKIEDVVMVATVRESIRDRTVRVDAAEIALRVEAAQVGKLSSARGVDDPLTRPAIPDSCHVDDPDGSVCPQTFPFKGVNVPSVNSKNEASESDIDLRMDATVSSSVTVTMDANIVDPGLAVRAEDDVENLAKEDTPGEIYMRTVEQSSVTQDALSCPGAGRSQGCVLCGDQGKCIFCISDQGAGAEDLVEEAIAEWVTVEEAGLGCENEEAAAQCAPGEELA